MLPLAVHSHYSLMRGTTPVAALCRAARRMGYTRLGLTDTDNLYGLWSFVAACRREEIVPIIGATVTAPDTGEPAVCLVENDTGYRNLCRLITRRHCDPAFDLDRAVAAHADGLLVLTNDPRLLAGWHEQGVAVAAALPIRPCERNSRVRQQALRLGLPAVAIPDSYFLEPADFHLHRLLRAIHHNTTLSRPAADDTVHPEAWLAPPAIYAERFAVWPETLHNSHLLAERCTFAGPRFGTVMPPYGGNHEGGVAAELRQAAYAGAQRRYGDELPEKVVARLEHELRIIGAKNFAAYFLVVRDIVSRSPRICGRGSGAASLVAYSLGITNVCPVRHDLYFERFLNPDRLDPPDIDVDFAWDERDAVLESVLRQYGDRAALVSTHVLFQPRLAIREVAKVYGLAEGEIAAVTRRLPWAWGGGNEEEPLLPEQLRQIPNLRDCDFPPPWPEILALAGRLIGTPRHLSVHPGGVVITPGPLSDYVPLERAPKGVPIIQWEKDAAEEAGLVKIDLLGNRSLGVIRDALAEARHNGTPVDEGCWQPEEDNPTQELIARGETMGCFYIESPATRLLQQKAGVGDFGHLVIHSSIIRPAANDFIREYIRRLHGGAWEPLHPLLAEIMAETYGIMVYQEDVSRVAVALAGFSHAKADGLRKVMGKKDRTLRLADYREDFFSGARERGVAEERIAAIWEMMLSFSGYSFCKPHSASYARVSFQAAYLKRHRPAEFMAAVISNQGGFYSTFAYVSEARRLGLEIQPPDVMASRIPWSGGGRALRVGLMAIHSLSQATMERIVAQRADTPYRSMADFIRRATPSESEARFLIHAGALDRFNQSGNRGANRAALLWELARLRQAQNAAPMLELFAATRQAEDPLPVLPPENRLNRLRREFEALGFLLQGHPMELYAAQLRRIPLVKARELPGLINRRIAFAGWLLTGKTAQTKHGEAMEFLTFEDETGLVETTFFPAVYHRSCHLLRTGRPFLLHGKVEEDYGAITLTVDAARVLTGDR